MLAKTSSDQIIEVLTAEANTRYRRYFEIQRASAGRSLSPDQNGRHDRYRLIYSGHFLRLAEVTQTISPLHGYIFHNRLSHSLKVGETSAVLARHLKRKYLQATDGLQNTLAKYIDPELAECAGYAHDLGHPPFGHVAEAELDLLARENGLEDGFEGNAQTFRIACRLAGADLYSSDADLLGLNLTQGTLAALIKYPQTWSELSSENQEKHRRGIKKAKWGAFHEDESFFINAILDSQKFDSADCPRRSVEAEVMDWADDITFAVHDLLDFYAAGQIPLFLHVDAAQQYIASRENFIESRMPPEWRKFITYLLSTPNIHKLIERARNSGSNAQGTTSPSEEELKEESRFLQYQLAYTMATHFKFFTSRYTASPKQRRNVAEVTSDLIEQFANAIEFTSAPQWDIIPQAERRFVQLKAGDELTVEILKQFTWHYVILGHNLSSDQSGYRFAVRTVFLVLRDNAEQFRENAFMFPEHIRSQWSGKLSVLLGNDDFIEIDYEEPNWDKRLKNHLDERQSLPQERKESVAAEAKEKSKVLVRSKTRKQRVREIVDYVSSMSEPELMRLFKQVTGHNSY